MTIYKFLNEWQTLIAGVLALAGAYWTVLAIRAQIRQTQQSEDQRRNREEFAARALLPLALADASTYAQECIKLLHQCNVAWSGQGTLTAHMPLPKLNQKSFEMLQDCARYAEPHVAQKIATVVTKYQVQQSRLAELFNRAASQRGNLQSAINAFLDAADLSVAADELYEYGRAASNFKAVQLDKLSAVLILAGINEVDQPKVFEEISRRIKLEARQN